MKINEIFGEISRFPTVDINIHGIPGVNKVNFVSGLQHRGRLKFYKHDHQEVYVDFKPQSNNPLIIDVCIKHGNFESGKQTRFAINFLKNNAGVLILVATNQMDEREAEKRLVSASAHINTKYTLNLLKNC